MHNKYIKKESFYLSEILNPSTELSGSDHIKSAKGPFIKMI